MEPNNFEKDFREKLNKRKIEPGDKAWDRLDAMLSIAEEKKQPEKKNKWLYIAASVVGFMLVGTFFFNNQKNTVETSKSAIVIEENAKKDTVVKPILNTINPFRTEVAISEKESIQKANKKENKLNPKPNKNIKSKSNQIAESSVIIIKKNQEKQSINNQASVVEISKNEIVDQLLNSAEKTVVAENSSKKKSKVKINANDLLNQVDDELELSFRERVITTVNKNYQTIKVAVANRNQQE